MRFKIFPGWLLVGAVLVALMLSGATVIVSSFGIVTAHLTDRFGWSQVTMAGALSVALLATTLAVPLVGLTVDRFGTRRTAIAGSLAFAAVLASAGLMVRSLPGFYGFYALLGVVGAFTNPIVYIAALSAWFDRQRGVALGLAVAGQGLGGAVLPVGIETIARQGGWAMAFAGMAVAVVLVAVPLILAFVHDHPAARGCLPDHGHSRPGGQAGPGGPAGQWRRRPSHDSGFRKVYHQSRATPPQPGLEHARGRRRRDAPQLDPTAGDGRPPGLLRSAVATSQKLQSQTGSGALRAPRARRRVVGE